jgi:V/A-type H+-transporting ATPase subunit E
VTEGGKKDKHPAASGVEKLIERLKQEGVAAGQQEAERLVAEAQRRADWILDQAREEIEAMQKQAEESMARERAAAQEALRVAARDTVLQMREGVVRRFRARLHSLVGAQLEDPAFLQKLILEVAGRARQDAGIDAQTRLWR